MHTPDDAPAKAGTAATDRSEFARAFRMGILVGAAALAVLLPLARHSGREPPASPSTAATGAPAQPRLAAPLRPRPVVAPHLAAFRKERASSDARQVADWALYTGDNQGHAVVIVDKRQAKVFVFDPTGKLQGASPVLLGSAKGDHTVPGIGDKPLSQVMPEERTTPAGRFVAEHGVNAGGEDVVWVDYDAAVSMHRVRALVKSEHRLERLASPTPKDNRISYGCINMPPAFYERVLLPAVQATGAVIYVLPETKKASELFGSYDVDAIAAFALR